MNRSKPEISFKPLDMREITFSSLLLLGFDTREMEEKYNIPFTKDMFSLPNKKGFEVVMHFLFERLNAAMAQERFRSSCCLEVLSAEGVSCCIVNCDFYKHCWPILDKKQEQNFRKTISAWLTEISKRERSVGKVVALMGGTEGPRTKTLVFHPVWKVWILEVGLFHVPKIFTDEEDANLPRIVPSLFMSPGGDKFYTLLFYFTNFVMLKISKNEYGVKSRDLLRRCTLTTQTKQFAPVMAQTIQASTVVQRKKFLHYTRELAQLQNEWKKYASILVKEYRSLSKKIRELEHSIREQECRMIAYIGSTGSPGVGLRVRTTGLTDGEWDVLAVKRAQRVQKVRDLWKSLETCCEDQANERAVVESITAQRAKKDHLDAAELPVQVPEILLRECEQEIQRRRINNVYEGGKLDLVSLIRLWNLALRLYMEKLNEAPLPDFEEMIPSVVTQVHTQNAHLANARALRNSLAEEVLPDLERSVLQLLKYREEGVELPTRDTLVKASPRHFLGNGVGLLPPTPPVSFDPATTPKTQATPFQKASSMFKKSPDNADTPEVMTQLRESVNKAALKKTGLTQGTPTSSLHEVRVPTQSIPKFRKQSHTTREIPQKRTKSSTSSHATRSHHETPVSTRRHTSKSEVVSRHPPGKRMVQTTVKKKRSTMTHKPPGTERKSHAKAHFPREHESSWEPTTHASMDKAHSILIDQIVDSVISGSKSSERSSPTLTPDIQSSEEEPSPISLAVEDPLGALGLDAFVTREKLRHSPVDEMNDRISHHQSEDYIKKSVISSGSSEGESTMLASSLRSDTEIGPKEKDCGIPTCREPHEGVQTLETGTLIDLETEATTSGISSNKRTKPQTQLNPDFAAWNATLQRVPTSRGPPPLMSDEQEYSSSPSQTGDAPLVEDLLHFDDSDGAYTEGTPASEVKDYGRPDREQSSPSEESQSHLSSTNRPESNVEHFKDTRPFVSPFSPDFGSFESPSIKMELNERKGEENMSNWHLDEELPEIFQTRTPQLPERLRRKISDGRSPLYSEVPERSTPGRSASPSSFTRNSNASSDDSFAVFPEARKLQMTSSVEEDEPFTNSTEREAKAKRRAQSGNSQKSVTFSEPLPEEGSSETEFVRQTESISEETMPAMAEESFSSSPLQDGSPIMTGSPTGVSHLGLGDRDVLGNEYLVSSPQPPLKQVSHIDDTFSIDLESPDGEDISFHLNRPIEDLLEHFSPTVSPSKTPQIRLNRSHYIPARSESQTPDNTPELPIKSRPITAGSEYNTPLTSKTHGESYLSQRISDMRVQPASLGVNGSPHHFMTGIAKSAGLNLLDEDESLLIPKSPVL